MYIIQSTKEVTSKSTGKTTIIIGYYKKGLSFGNIMEPDINEAKMYDTKEEALKVKKIRFNNAKHVKVIQYK